MTLCISFKDRNYDGISRAICYSDSIITTLTPVRDKPKPLFNRWLKHAFPCEPTYKNGLTRTEATLGSKDQGAFLPSNVEIKHQTKLGIKIQIVSAISNSNKENRDFILSIAGAVDLGLRSLTQLDSEFRIFCSNFSFIEQLKIIKKTLYKFWETAHDKDIEYLITTTDDNEKTRIFHVSGGTESSFKFNEIEP